MIKKNRFKVGILGVQPGRSWAAVAHLPALRALADDFEVIAIANTNMESAKAAAAACHVPLAFAGVAELVNCAEVDMVVVTVKVPHHLEAVSAALAAGKNVYCEWPLGNGLDEGVRLAEICRDSGLLGVVGTQARVAPEIVFVRDLIADGFIGEVLSTTLTGVCENWSGVVDQANAYTQDEANGASMLTIPFAHTMAAVVEVLGDFDELSAVLATRRTAATVRETGALVPITVADQVLVQGVLHRGAPISAHFRGGITRAVGFRWEINGTAGDIEITGSGGNAQIVQLTVLAGQGSAKVMSPLEVPEKYRNGLNLDVRARNIANVYKMMADDLRNGTRSAPDFDSALKLHRLVAAIEDAAKGGVRVKMAPP